MPTIKTNFLRMQHKIHFYRYELVTLENCILEDNDKQEIQIFLSELASYILYQHPYILTPQPLSFQKIDFMLSKGVPVRFAIEFKSEEHGVENKEFFRLLSRKLMKSTQFLYSKLMNTCFNAFQQVKINEMIYQWPGFSIEIEPINEILGLYIIPLKLQIKTKAQINTPGKILLDNSNGKFYNKQDIVRIDKNKSMIYFRKGQIIKKQQLKLTQLKNSSGYQLTIKLYNYINRIKQSKDLLNKWSIQLDTKFYDINHNFIQIGKINFRDSIEKSLNDLVFPVARNTYNHYFRNIFENINFDDILDTQLTLLIPEQLSSCIKLSQELQKIKQRMNLKITIKNIIYRSMSSYQEMISFLNQEIKSSACIHIFVLDKYRNYKDKYLEQQIIFTKIKQLLIQRGIYFHILEIDYRNQDQYDIIAYRQLAVIYAKLRMNPWKLKDIPFGQKPTVVISLNVQTFNEEQYSVAIVCTLNAFFSKYTATQLYCKQQQLLEGIFLCLRQCLDKFENVHHSYPYRVFIYRTGEYNKKYTSQQQQSLLRNKLTLYYGTVGNNKMNTLTYIVLTKTHPLRIYTQIDQNSVSLETIKKVQLLCSIQYNSQYYVQLQFDEPIMKVQIIELEKDPAFIQKVLQLTCKIVYGSVGNQFGQGLGFIDFANKLNCYKDYSIDGWRGLIKDGIMMFL